MSTLFRFNPDVPTEVGLVPAGRYEAEILNAELRTSKAGNEMLEITYRLTGPNGEPAVLKDYLVSTPRAQWKIKRFCKALGVEYDRGEIDPDSLRGESITLEVALEEDAQTGRDRNTIADYAVMFEFGRDEDEAGEPVEAESRNEKGRERRPPRKRGRTNGTEEEIPF